VLTVYVGSGSVVSSVGGAVDPCVVEVSAADEQVSAPTVEGAVPVVVSTEPEVPVVSVAMEVSDPQAPSQGIA
jgi:hypothetical protein